MLADTLRTNSTIETLRIASVGAKSEALATICTALSANKNIGVALSILPLSSNLFPAITEMDLSNNLFEDKGMLSLAAFIATSPIGMVRLDISNTGLGKTGTSALGNALKKNVKMSATLFFLNISGNKLDAEV